MVQTIHVSGRILEAYNPELSVLDHWNRIRVGCLGMQTVKDLILKAHAGQRGQTIVTSASQNNCSIEYFF